MTVDGVQGVRFAVWAPNAERVAVIGDFNSWDARRHPMRLRFPSGIWELFVPRLAAGALYKFDIVGPGGVRLPAKADPVAQQAQPAPATASVVASTAAPPPGTLTQRSSAKPIVWPRSSLRECTSTGRRCSWSATSATRAERLAERTDA